MSGISGNYNSGGNIYTTGWRGAGSAGSAGSADSMSSAGFAGSFGSTAMGSATGSFGIFEIGPVHVYVRTEYGRDYVFDEPVYWPTVAGRGDYDGIPPFTNEGYLESISD